MNDLSDSLDIENGRPEEQRRIGRFTVVRSLGRGGMGEVFKVYDRENSRYVAIKTLDPDQTRDAETLKRFEREARSAIILDHPNIAKIFGLEYERPNHPYIVMEYIEGDPLERYARGGSDEILFRSEE